MAYDKYIKGGSLNPFWINELRYQTRLKNNGRIPGEDDDFIPFSECLENVINNFDSDDDCDDISYEDELEAKFNFLKKHSDSEEDLELAKQILGL